MAYQPSSRCTTAMGSGWTTNRRTSFTGTSDTAHTRTSRIGGGLQAAVEPLVDGPLDIRDQLGHAQLVEHLVEEPGHDQAFGHRCGHAAALEVEPLLLV